MKSKKIYLTLICIGLSGSAFMTSGAIMPQDEKSQDIVVIEHSDKWLSISDYRTNIDKAVSGNAESQRIVARCYMNGIGVPTDYTEAWKWMARSAGSGDNEAQYQLGLMYRDGRGVKKDAREAMYWFRRSARNGHPEALLNLGNAFEKGLGVQSDLRIAAQNYWRAGEHGNGEGSYRYAVMLRDGHGIEQDLQSALKYFLQADKQGYEGARAEADRLESRGIRLVAKPGVRKTAPKTTTGAGKTVKSKPAKHDKSASAKHAGTKKGKGTKSRKHRK